MSDKPLAKILSIIAKGNKKNYLTDYFYTPNIDFTEFKVTEGKIEITRKPSIFSPYRPTGTITIGICENAERKSQLSVKVLIPKNRLLISLIIVYVFLSFWTLISLIISRDTSTIMVVVVGWFGFGPIMGLISYLFYRLNDFRLIKYSKIVINELCKTDEANFKHSSRNENL